MSFDAHSASVAGQLGALTIHKCGWCEWRLRPCNMRRHVDAQHFRQLTIEDALDGLYPDADSPMDGT